MPITKWTKSAVIESAKNFDSIQKWRKVGNAYSVALKNGWLNEATVHMVPKKRKIWTYEELVSEAQKFKSLKEWRTESKSSYSAATKKGVLDALTQHMVRLIKPNGYWTKERVIEDAKNYNSRSEWRNKSSAAATMAKRNGWYEEATSHMLLLVDHSKWTKNAVLAEAKNYASRSDWSNSKNGSYGAALRNGWLEEAALHMTRPDMARKWTKSKVIEDAKKYETRGEWHKASGHAAHLAIKRGWHDEATAHMHRVYSFGEMTIYKLLTQLNISFEVQKRFKEIKSKYPLPFDFYLQDFNLVIEYQGSQHFFETTRKFGENLASIQSRDQIKLQGAAELKLNYLAVSKTLEREIEDAVISKIQSLKSCEGFQTDYKKRPLTAEETQILKSLGTFTKEQVLLDAKKYKTYPEWRSNSPTFQVAIKNGWLEECKMHMLSEFETRSQAKLVWTKEKVIEDALKHTSRSSWKNANPPAYSSARKRGWLDEATAHMARLVKPNGYWSKEKVLASALKFQNRTSWMRSQDSAAYNVARKNGWLEEACLHMSWLSTKPKIK